MNLSEVSMEIFDWLPGVFTPGVKTFLMSVGVLHLSIPAFEVFVRAVTDATPSKKDDEWAELAFSSKAWNIFVKAVAYLSAIKLPKKKTRK